MGQGTRSVLVVDDNAEMRQALAFVLEAEGYIVMVAGDGLEALTRLREDRVPGVILLDLMMPNMDGAAFRRHQLDDPRLAEIPVVVCSGERSGAETALRLGTEGYLAKPLDVDRVLGVVQRFCA